MPRKPAHGNAKAQAATQRWRDNLAAKRRPEVDAVDAALSAAVAVYTHIARAEGGAKDCTRALALETLALNYLSARGYDWDESVRTVRRRVLRKDIAAVIALTSDRPAAAKATLPDV